MHQRALGLEEEEEEEEVLLCDSEERQLSAAGCVVPFESRTKPSVEEEEEVVDVEAMVEVEVEEEDTTLPKRSRAKMVKKAARGKIRRKILECQSYCHIV